MNPNDVGGRKRYVLGFVIDKARREILLIEKGHGPESIIGKLNGIGGSCERWDVNTQASMAREAQEETGLAGIEWLPFCTLTGRRFAVDCFVAWHEGERLGSLIPDVTPGGEKLTVVSIPEAIGDGFLVNNVVPDLRFLIPMALTSGLTAEVHVP